MNEPIYSNYGRNNFTMRVEGKEKIEIVMNFIKDYTHISEKVKHISLVNACNTRNIVSGGILNGNDSLNIVFDDAKTLAEVQLAIYN